MSARNSTCKVQGSGGLVVYDLWLGLSKHKCSLSDAADAMSVRTDIRTWRTSVDILRQRSFSGRFGERSKD